MTGRDAPESESGLTGRRAVEVAPDLGPACSGSEPTSALTRSVGDGGGSYAIEAVFTSTLLAVSPGRAYGGGSTGATPSAPRITANAKGPSIGMACADVASSSLSSERSRNMTFSPSLSSSEEEESPCEMPTSARLSAEDWIRPSEDAAGELRCGALAVRAGRTGVAGNGLAAIEVDVAFASERLVHAVAEAGNR